MREITPILSADGVGKSYQSAAGSLWVLREVSFEVPAGSSCAIVGPSGSGKTTLLGLCAGLDRPTSGTITVAGASLGELDEEGLAALRAHAVGFVFQTFQLLPTLTAVENVMVPLELQGQRRARERAGALLGQVGLGDRLGHYPAQLSGGEQQRVAIARAFVHQPRILFADEPTGNLDGATSALVQDLLFELNHSRGTSLVLVTHDLDLARRADRVVRLRDGRRVDEGAGAELPEPAAVGVHAG
ncbi:MAG TPA: ABC transporter ATP-binding protein [Thermoanaerobaculia bacterium]|nr:ABC transporter ATP-binding protein [Thermoanaerobaculia bacterium]